MSKKSKFDDTQEFLLFRNWKWTISKKNTHRNLQGASLARTCMFYFYDVLSSDDPLVMAGLGTVGLEIVTQLPEVDAVVVPAAAGALLAGTLVACKKLKCSCLVYVSRQLTYTYHVLTHCSNTQPGPRVQLVR